MDVAIFIPCFIDQFYPQTAFNMVKVLEKAGCTVQYNPEQTCCGQPAFNAGFWEEAKEVAQKWHRDFSHNRTIVCPSASCVGFMRNNYKRLLGKAYTPQMERSMQERVWELSSFLVDVLGVEDLGATLEAKVAYHDSCSALRECKIKEAPRKLLSNVAGLELQEINDGDVCCGFGGTFSVKYEAISVAMAEQKIDSVLASTDAEYLISTDLSCLMHLETYLKKQKKNLKTLHIADVLASGW
jgi:L-lactate dehydrogenase complex protein LldE